MSFLCTRCDKKFASEDLFVAHSCRLPVAELSNLIGGYSLDNYGGDWTACIKMLRKRGMSDREIEAVLRSKWTRWAADASSKSYGKANSADLARFLDTVRDLDGEVKQLVLETFS